jgi:hypothetical protein
MCAPSRWLIRPVVVRMFAAGRRRRSPAEKAKAEKRQAAFFRRYKEGLSRDPRWTYSRRRAARVQEAARLTRAGFVDDTGPAEDSGSNAGGEGAGARALRSLSGHTNRRAPRAPFGNTQTTYRGLSSPFCPWSSVDPGTLDTEWMFRSSQPSSRKQPVPKCGASHSFTPSDSVTRRLFPGGQQSPRLPCPLCVAKAVSGGDRLAADCGTV